MGEKRENFLMKGKAKEQKAEKQEARKPVCYEHLNFLQFCLSILWSFCGWFSSRWLPALWRRGRSVSVTH